MISHMLSFTLASRMGVITFVCFVSVVFVRVSCVFACLGPVCFVLCLSFRVCVLSFLLSVLGFLCVFFGVVVSFRCLFGLSCFL